MLQNLKFESHTIRVAAPASGRRSSAARSSVRAKTRGGRQQSAQIESEAVLNIRKCYLLLRLERKFCFFHVWNATERSFRFVRAFAVDDLVEFYLCHLEIINIPVSGDLGFGNIRNSLHTNRTHRCIWSSLFVFWLVPIYAGMGIDTGISVRFHCSPPHTASPFDSNFSRCGIENFPWNLEQCNIDKMIWYYTLCTYHSRTRTMMAMARLM